MRLQQHGQLSVPRTWAFGLAEAHNQRWCLSSGQEISGKIKKHQPRLTEEDLPLQKCWIPANQAHVKPADFHSLLLEFGSTPVALGFQIMTVKHSTEPQFVMAKTDFTSKARRQPVDALIIVNNPLLLLPKEQGQEPGRLCLLLGPSDYSHSSKGNQYFRFLPPSHVINDEKHTDPQDPWWFLTVLCSQKV